MPVPKRGATATKKRHIREGLSPGRAARGPLTILSEETPVQSMAERLYVLIAPAANCVIRLESPSWHRLCGMSQVRRRTPLPGPARAVGLHVEHSGRQRGISPEGR